MIPVFLYGGYRNRNPLAYAAIRERLGDRVALVDTPGDARLLVISHYRDFELFAERIYDMLAASPTLRLVMLSEEPFWDSIWMPDPFSRRQHYDTGHGRIPYTVINHQTSAVFRARSIPYFLLTDPRYIAHYRPLLDRNAGRSAEDWMRHFADTRYDAVFVAERRPDPLLSPAYPTADLIALSGYRSAFAERCDGARVERRGAGWTDGPPRQDLPDWHTDKLTRYDLSCRYMAAFENTHQPEYVTEKIYDALAMGAVPLYAASAGHAVHRLVGPKGWLNFFDRLDPVPAFDARQPIGIGFCGAYAALQDSLARLFGGMAAIDAEYDRLCDDLVEELGRLAE